MLMEKLKRGLPVPFVINENDECLFLIKNQKAQDFSFTKHVKKQMGLNYFEICHVKHANSLWCLTKEGGGCKILFVVC